MNSQRSLPITLKAALCIAALGLLQGCATRADGRARVQVVCAVDATATESVVDLRQQGVVQQQVDFKDDTGAQARSYTGAALWPLLQACALQSDSATDLHGQRAAALGRYVLASGAEGYSAVFSVGELHPDFGNKASVVAYAEAGAGDADAAGTAPSLRITAPGDLQGSRYVAGLTRLEVRASGSVGAGSGAAQSQAVQVLGAVKNTLRLDEAALRALPAVTQVVGGRRYTGVDLWALLSAVAGIEADRASGANVQGMYLVATGADGYQALVSLAEMSPELGNQRVLIAYRLDEQPLARGMARLVVAGDGKAGRSVSALEAIEVFAAAPAVP
ncbi:molybdopterin-binding oxidoreductase [Acidovorax sp. A1169]|uniref:molybdopterin-binding oxidoreductase n=1 Tax=Acidovorax sp. A1169 TaxID=3059524 RepID=UPI0027377F7E|nr:molybdopterin-binding oxidoreductase [Acidovorax sp. A1169]MDP4076151.1 molybdopterin-binding oxidoreductase [Acidovorax sp. A1169]